MVNQNGGRVAAYIRVSKEREGMTAPSLYRDQILRWAERKNIKPERIEWFEDIDVSGRLPVHKRPAFAEMMGRRDEFETFVVPNIARWGRDLLPALEEFARLKDSGGAFEALDMEGLDTSTATGELMLHNMMSQAHFQSKVIGEAWVATHARRRREGHHHAGGGVPFGYRHGHGEMVPWPEEARTVQEAYRRYAAGESQASIARDLGLDGTKARMILTRHVYAGLHEDGTEGTWEALVGRELWDSAQAIRKSRGKLKGRPVGSGESLLSGLLVCGRCGSRCHIGGDKYRCTNASNCGMWQVGRARAEQAVIDEFGLHGLDHLKRLAAERRKNRNASPLGAIDAKIAKVDQKIARLVRRVAESDSPSFVKAFDKEAARLEAERQALDIERAKIKVSETGEGLSVFMEASDDSIKKLQEYLISIGRLPANYVRPSGASNMVKVQPGEVPLAEAWLAASTPERQRLLAAAIERVETVEKPGAPRGVKVLWRAA